MAGRRNAASRTAELRDRQARRAGRPTGRQRAPHTVRRRRAGIVVAGVAGLCAIGIGASSCSGDRVTDQANGPAAAPGPAPAPKSPYGKPTSTPLPPQTRVVAFAGAPQAPEFGILGTLPLAQASKHLAEQSRPYARKTRPVLPAYDLIATIANAHPGDDGFYRTRQPSKVIARHLRAARRHDAALILDVQPGTSNFVDETKVLERWLREPDVHLALDPEWRMRPGVRPGSRIGHVSHGELTATFELVAGMIRQHDLPRKLVLVHRFTDGMVADPHLVKLPPEILPVMSIDGVGSRALKEDTYRRLAPGLPAGWLPGFKVFYDEDAAAGGVMTARQVMALQPRPHVVVYE